MIRVRRKSDGMEMKINQEDYGPEKEFEPQHYRRLTVEELDEGFFDPTEKPLIRTSSYSESEMTQMANVELAKLPECETFDVRSAGNKENLIRMILAKREELNKINEETVVDTQTSRRRIRKKDK